jgi:hypothetical protein
VIDIIKPVTVAKMRILFSGISHLFPGTCKKMIATCMEMCISTPTIGTDTTGGKVMRTA